MMARVSAVCHTGRDDPIDSAPAQVGRTTAAAAIVRTCKVVRLGSADPNAAVVTAGRMWASDALNVLPQHAQIGISAAFLDEVRERSQPRTVNTIHAAEKPLARGRTRQRRNSTQGAHPECAERLRDPRGGETIMQMAVYAGFPAALNGLTAAKEASSEQ